MSRVFFCSEASFEAVLLGSWFEARIEASVSHCHHYMELFIRVSAQAFRNAVALSTSGYRTSG